MNDGKSNQQTVLQAASAIAKHTALLCNVGKQASTNAGISANGKQQFQLAAKNIATTTAALAQDIKALATAPSASTRENASKSSAPLLEAIEGLVALANSPEYGATPPTLSPMAQAKQKPLIDTSKNVISLTQDLVSTGKAICSSGSVDASQVHLLTTQSKAVSDSLKFLTTTVKQSAPGQQDIQAAIEKVSGVAAQLESASLHVEVDEASASGGNAVSGSNMNLAAASATGLDQSLKEKLLDNAKALASLIHMIADSAKGKIEQGQSPLEAAGNLSYAVIQLAETFQPMGVTAIGLSQSTSSKPFQKSVLEGVKRIADDTLTFLYAAKDAGGDAKNAESHAKIDSTMNLLTASLNKMALKLEGSTKGSAEISKVSSNIQDTLRSISENRPSSAANDSYQQYATQLFSNGKNLVDIVGDVITKSVKPDKDVLLPVIEQIGKVYNLIVKNAVNGSNCVTDPRVKQSLLDVSRELGGSTLKLVDAVKSALISASSGDGVVDPNSKQKLTNASKEVTQNVSKLMAVSKEGSKSLTACENVVELISDALADLESHIIFAQAGQLDSNDKEKFDAYQEELQSLARELVENSKALVSHGAMGKSDDLAVSATLAGETLMSLKESTKLAAFALTSNDSGTQEELLSQCRDVAKALSHLLKMAIDLGTKPLKPLKGTINATTIPTDFVQFREAAKDLVGQVGDFIKTVKYVGDESSRGARALESSAREIERAVQILEDESPAEGTALPDEVAQIAKSVAAASANLVSVASKGINNLTQDELVTSTAELKKVLLDLARAGKASTEQAPEDAKALMHGAIKSVADATCLLLNKVKLIAEGQSSGKSEVQYAAKEVASSVGKVVDAAGELIPGGYVDPNDPNVVAERELLAAASSIEAAARKLAMLKPPERPREANEDLNFEEQILEAAKAIASATSALIKSATSAQREIVAKGKVSNKREDQMYFSDGTWSDGLVSAAKNVASATGDLCEAANAAVKGEIQRERVIVSARNVSSSTIQLLHSAATRTDSNSQSQVRLKAAGKSVTQATEALVKAAEQTLAYEEEANVSSLMKGKGSNAMQKAQELEAAAKVLQMERELENARMKLAGMRKAKYKK
jgi:talin